MKQLSSELFEIDWTDAEGLPTDSVLLTKSQLGAIAQEAQRDTLKQVVDWGEQDCPHLRGGHKWECQHCTREFIQELKKLAEGK